MGYKFTTLKMVTPALLLKIPQSRILPKVNSVKYRIIKFSATAINIFTIITSQLSTFTEDIWQHEHSQ